MNANTAPTAVELLTLVLTNGIMVAKARLFEVTLEGSRASRKAMDIVKTQMNVGVYVNEIGETYYYDRDNEHARYVADVASGRRRVETEEWIAAARRDAKARRALGL